MKLEILVDTGEGEEAGGDNMEGEGGEETMVGEMAIEVILGLEGKMAVLMDKIGEIEALPIGTKIHLIKVLGVVEIIGMPRIHQVTSTGVAVGAQSHLVKINLPLGIVQRITNHL